MNAGRMDRKVDLLRPTTSTDSFGQVSETFTTEAAVWAQKKDVTAREAVEADQVVAQIRTEWTIRWRSDITPQWRIRYGSEIYTIDGILEIGRREGMKILSTNKDSPR